MRRFIHNFDRDNDFAISFKEFCDIVLPRKNNKLRDLVLKKETKGKTDEMILNKLTQLISFELSHVNKLAIISEKLRNIREYTNYEQFLLIDRKHEKYLNNLNLSNFMNKKEDAYSDNEINDLMFRLHKIENNKVSYEDFQEIFTPIKILRNESMINDEKPNFDKNGNKNYDVNQDNVRDKEAESNIIFEYKIIC